MNIGREAYFSCVVYAKRVKIKDLENYNSGLLDITEEDRALGYKHVFQTRPTKDTAHERIRGPLGMFSAQETFMDNDVQKLLDHMHKYYTQ